MKIAVISDIHSNRVYLDRFFEEIEKQEIEKIFCCGDLVGYYDEPNAVISRLRKNDICCVKGNHEKYLLGELTYNEKQDHVYGISSQRIKIAEDNYEYLETLPETMNVEIDGFHFYMTHSVPGDTTVYCYEPPVIDSVLEESIDFYLYGHTHIPLEKSKDGVKFVNPGSIGQPRDYSQKGSYAVITTTSGTVELCHFDVDVESYCKKLAANEYDAALINILKRTDDQRK